MKIAVIGSGNVGSALGEGWAKAGHEVVFGVQAPKGENDRPVAEAISFGDIVVLAIPYGAVDDVLAQASNWSGKIIVDCTNPIAATFDGLAFGHSGSAAEEIAKKVPGAKVVKGFNTMGFEVMRDPAFPDGKASLLIAGDDEEAKAKVLALAADLGFDPLDSGPLVQARNLEALAWLWISMAAKYGHGRGMAFRLMKR